MSIIVALLGIGQLAVSWLVASTAASAMHEITAAVLFGSGSICIGIATLIRGVGKIVNFQKKPGQKRRPQKLIRFRKPLNDMRPPQRHACQASFRGENET